MARRLHLSAREIPGDAVRRKHFSGCSLFTIFNFLVYFYSWLVHNGLRPERGDMWRGWWLPLSSVSE